MAPPKDHGKGREWIGSLTVQKRVAASLGSLEDQEERETLALLPCASLMLSLLLSPSLPLRPPASLGPLPPVPYLCQHASQ